MNWMDLYGLDFNQIPGDTVKAFSGAANSIKDIAVNGPTEVKALMAFAAANLVGQVAIAAAPSTTVTLSAAASSAVTTIFVKYSPYIPGVSYGLTVQRPGSAPATFEKVMKDMKYLKETGCSDYKYPYPDIDKYYPSIDSSDVGQVTPRRYGRPVLVR